MKLSSTSIGFPHARLFLSDIPWQAPLSATDSPISELPLLRLATLATALGAAEDETPSPQAASSDSRQWALLADTHVAEDKDLIFRGSSPYQNLQSIIPRIQAKAPSGAIIVGDVARTDGRTGDYRRVKSLLTPLASEVPIFLGLGNHDHRDRFHEVFPDSPEPGKRQPVRNKHVLVVDQAPVVRIVLLDSLHEVNRAPGQLGMAQRNWLANYLRSLDDDVPIVIALHHTLGEGGGHLQDTGLLFQLIENKPQVKALLYGHSHRFGITKHHGIHSINLPPVGYTFDAVSPLGWLDATFTPTGAELSLQAIHPDADPDGRRSTHSLTWR